MRKANLTVDRAVKGIRWKEGDPIQFEVKDFEHPGFYIRVSKGGTKQWFYRYTFNKRVRRMTLGHYPDTSCADAFADYENAFKLRKSKVDPQAKRDAELKIANEKKASEALTLSVLFYQHYWPRYAIHKRTARNDEHYFKRKIEPVLGDRPAESITPDDVESLIRPIEMNGYNTGRLTLALMRKMYNWAVMPESGESEGAGAVLDSTFANPCRLYRLNPKRKPKPIERYLKGHEIREIWQLFSDSNSSRILKLQLLTGCRVSEVCGMTEQELDRESGEWVISGERTRNGRSHLVPLNDFMIELIGPKVNGFIFNSQSRSGHTTISGPIQLLERISEKLKLNEVGTHTMRRTFITNMARMGVSTEIRNRLTNHADPSIDGLYNLHDYLQEKKRALNNWTIELKHILADNV